MRHLPVERSKVRCEMRRYAAYEGEREGWVDRDSERCLDRRPASAEASLRVNRGGAAASNPSYLGAKSMPPKGYTKRATRDLNAEIISIEFFYLAESF